MGERDVKAKALLAEGAFIGALPLALSESGAFDEFRQRRLIRYYLAAGMEGVAAAVHTTQFEIRLPEHNLFAPVLEIAADEIGKFEAKTGKAIVKIAGACGETAQSVAEAKLAKSLGYDAVLLSPGGLGEQDEAYLLERTEAVADILPVVGFYLQPAVGGRRLSLAYWQALCAMENVAGIKCAAFDRYATNDVVFAAAQAKRKTPLALYTGNDDHILLDLLTEHRFGSESVRFTGGLLGHWAVWVKPAVELFREAKNGVPSPRLLTLAAQVTHMNGAIFDAANQYAGCIAGVNEVLRRQGLFSSARCLNPAETLSEGQAAEIDLVCALYPHLTDDDFVAAFLREEEAGAAD